ncbi:MAG: DUF2130 domain-containing protein [Candidatus Roizmanbacteria bacterium]|nr:DUF2130 domain-containing protein [Candidatus Roizmanbacteria bacterium]
MQNAIKCPHCGEYVEVTEVLRKQIEEQVGRDLSHKHQKEIEELQLKIEQETQKKLSKKYQEEQEELQEELQDLKERNTKYRAQELELRKQKRELEEQKEEMALEVEKRLAEEKKQMEEAIVKRIGEEHRLKEMEKEKVISDLKKALEDAQRKAAQGSQQLQGEILELDLEELLRREFPFDTIEPVGKGVRGADIRHIVKSPRGSVCGVILWEFKRTKGWQDGWIQKLKDDMRSEGANVPVIVSTQMPKGIDNGLGATNGVWVCTSAYVLILAQLLRDKLYEVAKEKFVQSQKGTKAELLYDFITGHEFQQQVEAIVEVIHEQMQQITKERMSSEKNWKARETQIRRVVLATTNIYGSLQGLVGSSMPQVKGLELNELESGE